MTQPDARYPRQMKCASCQEKLGNHEFRGRSKKTPTCKKCELANPDHRWCLDCDDWLIASDFYWNASSQRPSGNRCKPCLVHRKHGVTRKFMAELTGHHVPQCSACGDPDRLSIDHDHGHCDQETGCKHCVRGYLCRSCNVAEGLLKTIERADSLVRYMKASRLTEIQLAALPPSVGEGRRRPSRTSLKQPHHFYRYPQSAVT